MESLVMVDLSYTLFCVCTCVCVCVPEVLPTTVADYKSPCITLEVLMCCHACKSEIADILLLALTF